MNSPELEAITRLVAGMPKADVLALVSRLCDAAAATALWSDDELCERFLGQCSRTGSRETISAYKRELQQLHRWIDAHHPGAPLRALTPPMAQHCLGDLRAQVAEGTMQPATFNRRLACWSSLWQWASDPCRAELSGISRTIWPRRACYTPKRVPGAMSEAELTAVLGTVQVAALRGDRIAARDYVLLRLSFLLGCRSTELATLRWRDVERLPDGGMVTIRNGRANTCRTIRVSGATVDLIETLGRGPADGWLFPNRKGTGPMSRQGICDRFRQWGRKAGVRLHVHKMRQTHAMAATRRGVDVFTLSANLGNASIASTGHYVASHPADSSSLRLG